MFWNQWGLHSIVNVPNCTLLKCLKRKFLCYMLFATIKRNGQWGIRGCSLNRRVKEASAMRWDLAETWSRGDEPCSYPGRKLLRQGKQRSQLDLSSNYHALTPLFSFHPSVQMHKWLLSAQPTFLSWFSPSLPAFYQVRIAVLSPRYTGPFHLSIIHTTDPFSHLDVNNLSGPRPATTSSGVLFWPLPEPEHRTDWGLSTESTITSCVTLGT